MKLNWPNYIFVMACVCGYFLFTKSIDSWLIGFIAAMGILLAMLPRLGVVVVCALLVAACEGKGHEEPVMDKAIADAIEQFRNRRIHSTLDAATLRAIPDADVEQAIFDYATTKLEKNYQREAQIVAGLAPGVRALYLTWVVAGEVNNGGFNQYYFNTEGKFSEQAVAAFELFGATEHANLMREANAVRAAEAEQMAKYHDQGTLEAFSESYGESKLGPLDDRFYGLKENLSALRIARIRAAPELFEGK